MNINEVLKQENNGKRFRCLANDVIVINDGRSLIYEKDNNEFGNCLISYIWLESEYEVIE